VESDAEFFICLSHLHAWMHSSLEMMHLHMKNNVPVLEEWLYVSILPDKERRLFAHRVPGAEGCNASVVKKNSNLSVKPSQGMDTSAKTMSQQSNMQLAQKLRDATASRCQ